MYFGGKFGEILGFTHFSLSKLNSKVTPRHLKNRALFAVLALHILSGCIFSEAVDGKKFDIELELLLTEIVKKVSSKKQHKQRFFICFKDYGCQKVYCGFLHQSSGV